MRQLSERLMVRNGTFYARIWVPTDIAPILMRKLLVTSLRTKDPKIARTRLAAKSLEADTMFDTVRSERSAERAADRSSFPRIAAQHGAEIEDLEWLARAQLFRAARADPLAFWHGLLIQLPDGNDPASSGEISYTYFDHLAGEGDLDGAIAHALRHRLKQRIAALRRMRAYGDFAAFEAVAETRRPGLAERDRIALSRLLLDEELRVLQAIDDGSRAWSISESGSDSVPPGDEAAIIEPATTAEPKLAAVSLSALFQRWEAEADPSASTLSSWRGIVRHLENHLGLKAHDVRLIQASDIIRWKDALVKEDKAVATISRGYLGCARALFRFALANGLIDADPSEGVKVARKTKPGTKMLGYTNEEVRRLLTLAAQSEEPRIRWLPWLAAATGSRIGEVAQLHGSHIIELDGVTAIKIAPASDGGTIKNQESERIVPLHRSLLDAGFLQFVEERGTGPLFYARSSGDPKRRHASKGVANRLAGWIRGKGFVDPRKAPNHAMRHWFKSELSRLGVLDSVADAIQGHSDHRSASVYRHVALQAMVEALDKLKLPPE